MSHSIVPTTNKATMFKMTLANFLDEAFAERDVVEREELAQRVLVVLATRLDQAGILTKADVETIVNNDWLTVLEN